MQTVRYINSFLAIALLNLGGFSAARSLYSYSLSLLDPLKPSYLKLLLPSIYIYQSGFGGSVLVEEQQCPSLAGQELSALRPSSAAEPFVFSSPVSPPYIRKSIIVFFMRACATFSGPNAQAELESDD